MIAASSSRGARTAAATSRGTTGTGTTGIASAGSATGIATAIVRTGAGRCATIGTDSDDWDDRDFVRLLNDDPYWYYMRYNNDWRYAALQDFIGWSLRN